MSETADNAGNGGRWAFSVAPMMDRTDRHCRYLHRLISPHVRLYTEMITGPALLHGPRARLLRHEAVERPLALQLGGADAGALAECARIGADSGHDEINLNCGCPSGRVRDGRFGAVLMQDPPLVARLVSAMKRAVDIPVTVKCRIGVDEQAPQRALPDFVAAVAAAGADAVIVHARKAWLAGLDPKQNRNLPPLDYALVRRLKADFPELPLILNGGLVDMATCLREKGALDGVMIGREAWRRPMLLAEAEAMIFGAPPPFADGGAIIRAMIPYAERQMAAGEPLPRITRHMTGLALGLPGARRFRRMLTEDARRADATAAGLLAAAAEAVDWRGGWADPMDSVRPRP